MFTKFGDFVSLITVLRHVLTNSPGSIVRFPNTKVLYGKSTMEAVAPHYKDDAKGICILSSAWVLSRRTHQGSILLTLTWE